MKKLIYTLTLLLLASLSSSAAEFNKESIYNYGEKAVYNLYYNWGFIWVHAGDCTFKVQNMKYNGKPTYAILVSGNSTKTFDKMYCIRDSFETFIDTHTLRPIYYRESKHEDSYHSDITYKYFERPNDVEVLMRKIRKGKLTKKSFNISKDTHDLIACCYNFRNLNTDDLKMKETVPFNMLFDNDIYNLKLTYYGKTNITLKNGKKYHALKFMPKLITGELFDNENDMVIYVSDDLNHVPLQINCKIKVGYVKAILNSVGHTKFPMTSEIKTSKKK